ncbi:MAG: hypothetical protein WDN31_20860 [Hyphomicrobium sp.]
MMANFSIITLGASAPDRLIEQLLLSEPLAAGSYSEYLAMANWDVRAHTGKFGWSPVPRPRPNLLISGL